MSKMSLPYSRQHISESDIQSVVEVLRSDWITQGPAVERFEQALCERFGVSYAVVVANGTAALHLACLALGVGPGDEVITTPNTFAASANCTLYCGGSVRFVDIDARTYNLSADRLEEFLSSPDNRRNVKGVIPVHFAGQPYDMERIHDIAQQNGLWVIEDACHAPGARWLDSSGEWRSAAACTHSDAAVLSFHPVKHMTTGEGGAILTNRRDLYEKLLSLRTHGITKDRDLMQEDQGPWYYEMTALGFNYRLTDMQCALGMAQMTHLNGWLERRREIAERYDAAFADAEIVIPPYVAPDVEHAYHLYVIQVSNRREVFERLRSEGIGVQVHYIPVHLQPYYRDNFGFKHGDFPVAEEYYSRCLSIPIFPGMTDDDVDYVVQKVEQAVMETSNVLAS